MLSLAVFYLVAVICSARRTHALPLYPETNLEPQAGKTVSAGFFHLTESLWLRPFIRDSMQIFMLRSVWKASAQVYLMMKDTWKQPPSLSLIMKMFWCMWQKMGKFFFKYFIKYFTEDSLFFYLIRILSETGVRGGGWIRHCWGGAESGE